MRRVRGSCGGNQLLNRSEGGRVLWIASIKTPWLHQCRFWSRLCQDRAPMKPGAAWTATQTTFRCPSCQGNLHSEPAKIGVVLFCPWAKCDCRKMNDGVEALSLGEAYAVLVDVFDSWLQTTEES